MIRCYDSYILIRCKTNNLQNRWTQKLERRVLTDFETSIGAQCLNVSLDLRNLLDVEERRRRGFSIILARHSMEDDWELARHQERAANEEVCSFFISARFQFIGVEPFVRILQDGVV